VVRTIILGVLFGAVAMTAVQAQSFKVDKDNRSIAVTASADASEEADVATVHIGFAAYGPDNDSAYAAGSGISNAIVKALTDAGVAKDAIESDSQQIAAVQPYEMEHWSEDQKKRQQFRLTQSWSVKTSAGDAAKVLDVAVKAGANQSGQIDWSVKDENALQAEAAGKALARAEEIAAQMAAGLHIKLGALLYASNEAPEAGRPIPLMTMATAKSASPVAPLAINARKVERSATVYAVFAIE